MPDPLQSFTGFMAWVLLWLLCAYVAANGIGYAIERIEAVLNNQQRVPCGRS